MGKDGSPEAAAKAKNSVPALPSFAGVHARGRGAHMVLGLVGAIGDGMSTSVMLFITSRIFNFLSSPASRLPEHAESRLLDARQLDHGGEPAGAAHACTRVKCHRRRFACARMLGARRSGMHRADNCGPRVWSASRSRRPVRWRRPWAKGARRG
jgi:hypothetical protein